MAKHSPVPGVIGLRGTDNRWNDTFDYGKCAVETDLVIGATTVNTFERHVWPGASEGHVKGDTSALGSLFKDRK